MTRADLLALTPQTLVALANRGLVKRAEKDLTAGSGPVVTSSDDGTVRGRFPDGTETVLPPGLGPNAADCTCVATAVCRHRIGLVLAYQRDVAGSPAGEAPAEDAFEDWSPGEFDDDALAPELGRPRDAPTITATPPCCTVPRLRTRCPGWSCPPARSASPYRTDWATP